MNNLNYVTYQTFPAFTANSIQTISNIKYFIKNDVNISLYFPLREQSSTKDVNKLKDFYSINEDFEAIGIKHNLPFGKIKTFSRIWFLISHFVWSYKTVKWLHHKKTSSEFFLHAQIGCSTFYQDITEMLFMNVTNILKLESI